VEQHLILLIFIPYRLFSCEFLPTINVGRFAGYALPSTIPGFKRAVGRERKPGFLLAASATICGTATIVTTDATEIKPSRRGAQHVWLRC
jgi:hypothetical protein